MGRSPLLLAAALITMQRGLPEFFFDGSSTGSVPFRLQIVEVPAKKQQKQI